MNISRRLNLGRQVPRCLHSHKGRVLPHPSFGRKVELQKSMFQFSEDKDIIFACQVPRLPGPPNSPRVVEADRSLSRRRRRCHALLRLLERQVIRNDDESFYDYYMTRYEDDMVIVGNYNGYVKCAEAFLRLGLSHQVSEKSFVCVY